MPNTLRRLLPVSLLLVTSVAQAAIPPVETSLKDRFEACRKWKDKISSTATKSARRDCTLAMKDAEKAMDQETKSPEMAALILRIVDISEMKPAEMTAWNHRTRPLCRIAEPYFKTAQDTEARTVYQSRCPTRAARIYKTN